MNINTIKNSLKIIEKNFNFSVNFGIYYLGLRKTYHQYIIRLQIWMFGLLGEEN